MELIKLSEIPDKVVNMPYDWYNDICDFSDSYNGEFNLEDLSDHDKLVVTIWAFTQVNTALFQRYICKQ